MGSNPVGGSTLTPTTQPVKSTTMPTKTNAKKKMAVPKAKVYRTAKATRLAVISSSTSRPGRRHASLSTKHPKPMCNEYGWGWTASTSPKTHALPLCKKCERLITTMWESYTNDPTHAERERLLSEMKAGILHLLEEEDDDD